MQRLEVAEALPAEAPSPADEDEPTEATGAARAAAAEAPLAEAPGLADEAYVDEPLVVTRAPPPAAPAAHSDADRRPDLEVCSGGSASSSWPR